MPPADVRLAREHEADRLAAVYRSAYAQNAELGFPAKAGSATAETVREWITEDRLYVATVDEEDGEIVVGGVRLRETDPDRIQLGRLGVPASWKGAGIGSRLLDHAESVARKEGYATIWLTTPPEHPFLAAMYRDRGYVKTGDYPLEYRDYDEIVLEKALADGAE